MPDYKVKLVIAGGKKLEKEKQAMLAEIRASNQHHERKGDE